MCLKVELPRVYVCPEAGPGPGLWERDHLQARRTDPPHGPVHGRSLQRGSFK